jgi:spermidine synthase
MTELTQTTAAPAAPTSFRPGVATLLLSFAMFTAGASGLVSEYVLATVSTYILGNSIEQFSVVIGLMLFMMGVAAWVQRFTSDRWLVDRFLVLEILLALAGGVAPMAIYAASAVMSHHFALVQYGFVMTIGFLIGFEIPVVLRINETYSERLKVNVGRVLAADYIGSLAGALFWTYVLLRWVPLPRIGVIMAALNFIVAALSYAYFARHGMVRFRAGIGVLLGVTAGVLALVYARSDDWTVRLEQRLYDAPIVHAETSRYQHMVMTHDRAPGEYRLYLNGNIQFSSLDEQVYHEHLVHPSMALAPRRAEVLILGGGDGLALREVLKYRDVRRVTLVDLDPAMTRFASTNPAMRRLNDNAFRDARVRALEPAGVRGAGLRPVVMETGRDDPATGRPRVERVAHVEVVNVDADLFLSRLGDRYDVVIADFPDPNAVELVKLYSKEFYLKLRGRVAPGGVVAVQATSPYHARDAFVMIRRTMDAAGWSTLPYHDNVPSFGDWGWIIGSVGAPDLASRARAVTTFPVSTRYLTPEVFHASLAFGKGALDASPAYAGRINTLMSPALLHAYIAEGWKVD